MKALVLFSGGLDSILAVKILARQGIKATALTFTGYFFGAEEAKRSAEKNGIKLRTENFAEAHLKIIRNPKFGRGAGMNPCIDCHLLMLKAAKCIMKKDKYDFLATGEVLGQRPMSQNARALKLIEREAGLEEKILRPLSAKVLPETEMEKTGLVDREKLLGISGRGRKDQIELAKKFGIKNYPTPAGGCILTDKEYSKKLRELMAKVKNIKPSDIALLRLGRHFWARPVRKSESPEPEPSSRVKIILGRNHEENLKLKKIAEKGDILVEPKDIPGPTALVRGKRNKDVLDFAKKLMLRYAKKTSEDISLKITAG